MKLLLVVILLISGFTVHAQEDANSGNVLLRTCTAAIKFFNDDESQKADFYVGVCLGYIQGISQLNRLNSLNEFCPHGKVTLHQEMRVVHKYLQSHPERLHEGKIVLVLDALKEAFPCKKE